MSARRVAIFLIVVLMIWTAMNCYVVLRVASIQWGLFSRRAILIAGMSLWLSYPLARFLEWRGRDWIAIPLEWIGANWIGIAFLLMSLLLFTDLITLGGWLFGPQAAALRAGAVILGAVLSLVALIQGNLPPVLRDYDVTLRGLPPEQDGLKLVVLTDLHLGTLIGRRWMESLARSVNELKPDVVVIVGDLIDGNASRVQPLVPAIQSIHAPLGVWAVTGNHEFHAGIERSLRVFEAAGLRVLHDTNAVVTPGLVLAGVDDLTGRREGRLDSEPFDRALRSAPPGGVILLSHTPWDPGRAARLGAGLMLCGHTHHGQVWPFQWLVRARYSLLGGRYEVDGMPVIVSRGAGTWGPRMRLWHRSEILRITLRS